MTVDPELPYVVGAGSTESDYERYRAQNLANWDERVAGHTAPDGYNLQGLIDNPDYVTPVVHFDHRALAPFVGDLSGKTLLHSQCHIGTDTLSWARLGASVTGLDFSPAAIASARETAAAAGIDAQFVETEFYDAPNHIDDQFDIVYTSVGAICWLPDIDRWAQTLASFLKPGGVFYIRDSHQLMMATDDTRDDGQLVVRFPYFHNPVPVGWDDSESYQGSAQLTNGLAWEWAHTLSDVINAVIGAGLQLERVEELQHLDWQYMPSMIHKDENTVNERWELPADQQSLLPLQFSIRARKPAP